MGDSSLATSSLGESPVLELSGKIMIAAAIVLFIVVTCVFLFHLYARWFWSTSEEPSSAVSWRLWLASQGQGDQVRGLSSSTIRTLPVVVFNLNNFKDGLECAVCLNDLKQGEKARLLPKCNHGFHVDCIGMWFRSHSTCPICRTVVASSSDPNSTSSADDDSSTASALSVESPMFPTNVLFWGDETQVRSLELSSGGGHGLTLAASSSGDMPMPSCQICPPSTARSGGEDEEAVSTRFRSLKRLLSRGKRVSPSPCTSGGSSGEQQV